jgi:hypothetical protein
MTSVNSPHLQTVIRVRDELAFFEWLEFYKRNGIFENLLSGAKSNNVQCVAVFGDWPPTGTHEAMIFEDRWYEYQYNANRATTSEERDVIKRRYALPERILFARSREKAASDKALAEAKKERKRMGCAA